MGGSGCGKSTLMKTIIGLNPPMAGDILIRGKSIIDSGKEIPEIQRSLGIMYQSGALFGSLTVLETSGSRLINFRNSLWKLGT